MQLDRSQLIKAIKFLKPAIMKGSKDILTFLHVRIDESKCILTASNGRCGKRVTLLRPPQLEFEEAETPKIEKNQFYLIPLAIVEAYHVLLQKHNGIYKDSADHTLKRVDIGPKYLESHIEKIEYSQPVAKKEGEEQTYPNRDVDFFGAGEPSSEMTIDTDTVIDAMREFGCQAEFSFSGDHGAVYVKNMDASYEAFFKPV